MASVADPAAHFNQGNALLERGETNAAIAAFRDCATLAPKHAAVRYNLGNALLTVGRPVEAVDAFLACIRIAPDFGAAYVNLANALGRLALLEPAQEMAELGVRLLPDVPEAKICLGNVLHDKSEYGMAAALYEEVLRAVPGHAGVLSSLGNTLRAMGCLDDALVAHQRAVEAAPDEPEFHFSRATALLTAGDFAEGWEEYEWRWRRVQGRPRGFGEAWRGQDLAGRTILLHAEQGLGDTLQFVRYVTLGRGPRRAGGAGGAAIAGRVDAGITWGGAGRSARRCSAGV